MNRLSKHDVNKLSIAKLKELLPCEVLADGEVVFVAYDVNRVMEKPTSGHDVNKKLTELPLSKHKQAQSTW